MASTRAASTMFQQHLVANMNDVEELMKENKMLDKKVERLAKKKKENLVKVCVIIENTKKMSFENYEAINDNVRDDGPIEVSEVIEEIADEGRDVESLQEEVVIIVGEQNRRNVEVHQEGNEVGVEELKREERALHEKMKESTKNLGDHKKMLVSMEKENGKDDNWHAQLNDVKKFTVLHQKYKEAKERRIDAIRKEVKRKESLKKKGIKEKIVTNQEASISSGAGSGTSSSRFAMKRKLNESVLDCGEIVKKIPTKEKEAMVPIVLKVEESPCEFPHECSFADCRRVLTNAASLATHLGKHYATNQAKIDCPFPSCQFTNTQEHLTKHMRSKHTKEQIFTCDNCSTKFHTMDAKVAHERKHGQQDIWGQCEKEDCLRFYQLTKGHRSCPKT